MRPSEPTREEIRRVVDGLRIRKRVREASGPHVVADCPTCGKEGHLYVNENTGGWDCKAGACGASGYLWSLATALGIRLRQQSVVVGPASAMIAPRQTRQDALGRANARAALSPPGVSPARVLEAYRRLQDPSDPDGRAVLDYLRGRGFDDSAIERFRLGVVRFSGPDEVGLGIPYLDGDRVPLMKMRNLATEKDVRRYSRTKGGESALYNAPAVRGATRVVLVEGELDAVSLWQLCVTAVASTSLGAKASIPEAWLRDLSDAEDVVLWYDADDAGREAVQGLVERLGTHRCRVAVIPDVLADEVEQRTGRRPKDANDLLVAGATPEQVRAIVDSAVGVDNVAVVPGSRFADQFAALIDRGEQTLGHPIPWANLQALLGGVREGEVTLVTGHTGHGKTTWAGALVEEMAGAGHPILVCSLENGAQGACLKSFQRMVGRPLSSLRTDREKDLARELLSHLDDRPIHYLDLHGRHPLDVITDGITYARYRLGVRIVLVDHLHFVSRDPRIEERQHLEDVMATLFELSRKLGVHIFVIAHPRGGIEENILPDGGSIKGASAMKQDTDNGITVWRAADALGGKKVSSKRTLKTPDGKRYDFTLADTDALIWVWKTRHDAARNGTALFKLDVRSLKYTELSAEPDNNQRARTEATEPASVLHVSDRDPDDPFDS